MSDDFGKKTTPMQPSSDSANVPKFTYALKKGPTTPTPATLDSVATMKWHQLSQYENEEKAKAQASETMTEKVTLESANSDMTQNDLKASGKTTRSLPLPFSPSPKDNVATTKLPVKALEKSIVKSLPPLPDSYLNQWYQDKYPLDYKRYGTPLYGYHVFPHSSPNNVQFFSEQISQMSDALAKLELELKREGEGVGVERKEKAILGHQNVAKTDRMSPNNFPNDKGPTHAPQLYGDFEPTDLSTSMTKSYPRYTFKILSGPNEVKMRADESQRQHSDQEPAIKYSYSFVQTSTTPISVTDLPATPAPQAETFKQFRYRIVDQTTARPEVETTPRRYAYGLATEPRSLETNPVTDKLKLEGGNKYTFKVLSPTAPSFPPKMEVQDSQVPSSSDGMFHLEQAAPTLADVFPTEDFGSKIVVDSRNKVNRVKIGSRTRGTTTPAPEVVDSLNPDPQKPEKLLTRNEDNNALAPIEDSTNPIKPFMEHGMKIPASKVEANPNEDWGFISHWPQEQQKPLKNEYKNNVTNLNETLTPIVEYEGTELQRLTNSSSLTPPTKNVPDLNFQQNFRSEIKVLTSNTPAPSSFNTPKHNYLSEKLHRTPIWPNVVKTLAPRIDNVGLPPKPEHVRLPGIRPDSKNHQPPFQITFQPVLATSFQHQKQNHHQHHQQHQHSHQDQASDKKIDEHLSQKKFFESTLKTSFNFEPLTIDKVKETISKSAIFNSPIERESNLRPQPRRPEPSRRPAFSIESPGSSTTKYPHEFSVITPHSYIDVKVKSNNSPPTTVTFDDVQVSKKDVTVPYIDADVVTAKIDVTSNDAVEPYQTTFASTRIDNEYDNFVGSTYPDIKDSFTTLQNFDETNVKSTVSFSVEQNDFMSTIADNLNFGTEEKLSQPTFLNDHTTYFGKMVFPTQEIETVTFAPFLNDDVIEKDILRAPVESTTPVPPIDYTTVPTVVDLDAQTLPAYHNSNDDIKFSSQNTNDYDSDRNNFISSSINSNDYGSTDNFANYNNDNFDLDNIKDNTNPFLIDSSSKFDSPSSRLPPPPPTVLPATVTVPFFNDPQPTTMPIRDEYCKLFLPLLMTPFEYEIER